MKNYSFSFEDVKKLSAAFGSVKVNKAGNIEITAEQVGDYRSNSEKYVLYAHKDGFCWRRFIKHPFLEDRIQPYQLFRNSKYDEWEAFVTVDAAIHKLSLYLCFNKYYNELYGSI